MNGKRRQLVLAIAAVCVAAGVWGVFRRGRPRLDDAAAVSRLPRISPDYSGVVIPPNIAPLNFSVREPGGRFVARIRSETGDEIEIAGNSAKIRIPRRRWRTLLDANRGKDLLVDVYTEIDGRWRRFQTIVNRIAKENIDGHIAYRLIGPAHIKWHDVGIYQRDLTSYAESPVLEGPAIGGACVNCHSFAGNDPRCMFMDIRSEEFGSCAVLVADGKANKINSRFGYTAWHPSGRLAAYTIDKFRQLFHTAGAEVRDVVDLDAALAYYTVDTATGKMIPGAADKQRLETYPAWAPDGQYLYYCSAPILWTDRDTMPPVRYNEVKYDLMRIGYDIQTDEWGKPQTVLSARETGLSILMPRISPDGKFLLFCMCDYGGFPVHRTDSDLYMMDVATGEYARLEINSRFSESWHSWSSNSRWIAFSSKRRGGDFTRCYFSFVDETGHVHKPFVLPTSDPEFYDSFLKTFSVPELLTGPVPVDSRSMARAVRSGTPIAVDAVTGASPSAAGSEPYQQATQ